MAKAYYSTVYEQTAEQVWAVIRDFNSYAVWAEGTGESHIEDGKAGDTVGAVRNVRIGDKIIRQRLLAHSDRDRFQVYEFCHPIPYPLRNYEATLRVTPLYDGNRAFVEWWVTFDCEASECDHWTEFFTSSFAKWLKSLHNYLTGSESVHHKLLGAWRLMSWEGHDATGNVTYPLGFDAIGQISYDASGRMSAHLVRPHQARFTSDDWQLATVEEKAGSWGNYFGYFGTYTIDEQARVVTHHIEGSWFPNLVGTKQVRYYHFDGDQLVLDADTAWGQVRIVWEKVR